MKVASVKTRELADWPRSSGFVRFGLAGASLRTEGRDEVTASFQLDNEWQDVTMAIGGTVMLVMAVRSRSGCTRERWWAPKRTALSCCLRLMAASLGSVKDLITSSLVKCAGAWRSERTESDGGGSATFAARLRNRAVNSPSEGERKTANGILLVNKAPEGAANKLVVAPTLERVLTGSSRFKTAAVDQNLHPAKMTEAAVWSVDPAYGTIDASGTFKAGNQPGLTEVSVQSGNLTGKAALKSSMS